MMRVTIDRDRCKDCGYCIHFCPRKAISRAGKYNKEGYEYMQIDREKCIVCGICYTVCPDGVFETEDDSKQER